MHIMYCPNCGEQIDDKAVNCPKCGVPVKNTALDDAPNMGIAILGFFIPLAGLILYLVWKSESPLRAKSAGKGALIGFITRSILYAFVAFVWVWLIRSIGFFSIPVLF